MKANCRRTALAMMLTTMFLSAPGAQTPVEASPPALKMGALYERHSVQAAVWFAWPDDAKGELEFDLPPFVQLFRQQPDEIVVTINTARPGPLHGTITARRGAASVEIAVDAVVLPPIPGQTRVLVASSPWHAQSTGDDAHFDPWRRLVATGKLQCHYIVAPREGHWIDPEVLQQVDVVLLSESCLRDLDADSTTLLRGFVCGGGRLVVCASPFYVGTVPKANDVLEPFGMRMSNAERASVEQLDTEAGDVVAHPLTAGVEQLRFHRAGPSELASDEAQALVQFDFGTRQPVVGLRRTGSGGEVVTLGVPLWRTWIAMAKDNERLLRNLLSRTRR
jgi:hypothetical protein